MVGAAILQDDTCLVAQRGETMAEPLKWEFPGGKIEPGESHEDALVREIREELHVDIEVGDYLGRGESVSNERRIVLDVYTARILSGELHLAEHRRADWLAADEIHRLDWAEADLPILAELERRLRPATT